MTREQYALSLDHERAGTVEAGDERRGTHPSSSPRERAGRATDSAPTSGPTVGL